MKNFHNFINEKYEFTIDSFFPTYDGVWTKEHHLKFIEMCEKIIGRKVIFEHNNYFYTGRYTQDFKLMKNTCFVGKVKIFINSNNFNIEIIDLKTKGYKYPIKNLNFIVIEDEKINVKNYVFGSIKENNHLEVDPLGEEDWEERTPKKIKLKKECEKFIDNNNYKIKDLHNHLNELLLGKEISYYAQTGPSDYNKMKNFIHKIDVEIEFETNWEMNHTKNWDYPYYNISFNNNNIDIDTITAWL
jgi:uncharacterized ubiquitin-like protein YukD